MPWYVDEDFSWLEEKFATDSVPAADINGLNTNNYQTWENMKALLGSAEEPEKTFIEIVADVEAIDAKVQLHDPILMRAQVQNNVADAAHDIDIVTPGWHIDTTGTYRMGGSAWTKRGDAAWDEGTNAGALFSGADMAANTYYIVYKIRNDTDGSIDYGWDTVANGVANLPAGWSAYRIIWKFYTNASGNIYPFIQRGNRCYWTGTPPARYTLNDPGAAQVLATVACPPNEIAIVSVRGYNGTAALRHGLFGNTGLTVAPGANNCTMGLHSTNRQSISVEMQIDVDSASRVGYEWDASSATLDVWIYNIGYILTGI